MSVNSPVKLLTSYNKDLSNASYLVQVMGSCYLIRNKKEKKIFKNSNPVKLKMLQVQLH
jgi:hypothetical protein